MSLDTMNERELTSHGQVVMERAMAMVEDLAKQNIDHKMIALSLIGIGLRLCKHLGMQYPWLVNELDRLWDQP